MSFWFYIPFISLLVLLHIVCHSSVIFIFFIFCNLAHIHCGTILKVISSAGSHDTHLIEQSCWHIEYFSGLCIKISNARHTGISNSPNNTSLLLWLSQEGFEMQNRSWHRILISNDVLYLSIQCNLCASQNAHNVSVLQKPCCLVFLHYYIQKTK